MGSKCRGSRGKGVLTLQTDPYLRVGKGNGEGKREGKARATMVYMPALG